MAEEPHSGLTDCQLGSLSNAQNDLRRPEECISERCHRLELSITLPVAAAGPTPVYERRVFQDFSGRHPY